MTTGEKNEVSHRARAVRKLAAASLIHDNRVSHVCPADYSEGSDMDILVKTIIDKIDLDDRLEKLEVVK